MAEIEQVVEEKKEEKQPEPKKLEDILQRYSDSQKELMEVLVNVFMRLDVTEKKLSSPLLQKLLE